MEIELIPTALATFRGRRKPSSPLGRAAMEEFVVEWQIVGDSRDKVERSQPQIEQVSDDDFIVEWSVIGSKHS